jgi:hypothetical protein
MAKTWNIAVLPGDSIGSEVMVSVAPTGCSESAKAAPLAEGLKVLNAVAARLHLLEWSGSTMPFFYVAAGFNLLAIVLWAKTKSDRPLELETAH